MNVEAAEILRRYLAGELDLESATESLHLNKELVDVQEWGGASFDWTDGEGKQVAGTTAWSIDSRRSDHYAPSTASFMVNYRVDDLHALVKALREEGCNVLDKIDDSEYGKFAWVIDPEGNKVELWQPPEGQ